MPAPPPPVQPQFVPHGDQALGGTLNMPNGASYAAGVAGGSATGYLVQVGAVQPVDNNSAVYVKGETTAPGGFQSAEVGFVMKFK